MRRLYPAIVLASLLLLTMVQVAVAAKPSHERFTIDETFEDELCGIPVTTHLVIKGHAVGFPDGHFVDHSRGSITWTNADGDWLTNSFAGPVTVTEQLDGSILTITQRYRGVHERLRSSEGLTAAFDRGQITIVTVIDLVNLEDPEDDVFVSSDVVSQHGPHPDADSGFALFCEVVIDVLG